MIEFFRDVLDGPLYIVVVVISIIFIMAIIGFLMEKKKLEKEAKEKIAVISNTEDNIEESNVTPVQPVNINEEVETPIINNEVTNLNEQVTEVVLEQPNTDDTPLEVKKPVYIFEDPDQNKE